MPSAPTSGSLNSFSRFLSANQLSIRPSWLISLLGIFATIAVTSIEYDHVIREDRHHIQLLVGHLKETLVRHIGTYRYGFGGARALFSTQPRNLLSEFKHLVASRNLRIDFPAALGMGYIERVPRSRLKQFESSAKLETDSDFSVKSSGDAASLYVVKYLEPPAPNFGEPGLDVYTNEVLRTALNASAEGGSPIITPPINLGSDSAPQAGFLYLLPVYRHLSNPITPDDRNAALLGWAFLPIVSQKIFEQIPLIVDDELTFTLYDSASGNQVIYDELSYLDSLGIPYERGTFDDNRLSHSVDLEVGERAWKLVATTSPRFQFTSLSTAWAIGILGTLLSLACGALAHTLQRKVGQAESHAASSTSALAAYKQIIDSHAIVSETDLKGNITKVNEYFCKLSGYSQEELIGQNHRLINSRTQPKTFWTQMWKTLLNGESWHGLVCNRKKDGTLYWVYSTMAPLFLDGAPQGYVSVRTDVTDLKLAQKNLIASEEKYRLLIEGSDVIIWEFDPLIDRYTFISPQAEGLGYPLEDWLSPKFRETHIPPEDQEKANYGKLKISAGKNYQLQYRIIKANGSIVWFDDFISVQLDPTGGKLLRGLLIDITERKDAENQLSIERNRLANVIEGTHAGTWELRISDEMMLLNERWARVIGYSLEELEPVSREIWERLVHFDDRALFRHSLEQCLSGERQYFECEYRMHHKNGGWIWVSDRAKVVSRLADGSPERMAGTHVDITKRKEDEKNLALALQSAEKATRTKSEFLANMSHEIRTPMNGVLGMTEQLLESKLTDDQRDLAETVRLSARSLLTIINDILDISKIEAQKIILDPVRVSIRDLSKELEAMFLPQVSAKSIRYKTEISNDIPGYVLLDSVRLRQILINLIGNAVKFTPHFGEVVVRVRLSNMEHGHCLIFFSVSDSGIGVPPEKQARIFEAFSQADSSTTRVFGGTGLGLSIAGNLIKLMGGTLELKSEVGSGSQFFFELKTSVVLPPESPEKDKIESSVHPAPLAPALQGLRILLAEDNLVNQKLAVRILQKEGHHVTVAQNGVEVLEQLKNGRFDIILMDLQMPEMGGEEATSHIRKLPGPHIPIIALTANAMAGDRQRCLDAGMDDYVSKPIDKNELFAAIRRAFQHGNTNEFESAPVY